VTLGIIWGLTAIWFAACGGEEHEEEGEPSGATCPADSTLTYDTFGQSFMEQYCTGCHSSALSGAARQGAPSDHDFDTLAGIRDVGAEHIDGLAAAGPSHVNTAMPPAAQSAKPSEAERRLLGEWLACGIP
jgi:cytochrome c5